MTKFSFFKNSGRKNVTILYGPAKSETTDPIQRLTRNWNTAPLLSVGVILLGAFFYTSSSPKKCFAEASRKEKNICYSHSSTSKESSMIIAKTFARFLHRDTQSCSVLREMPDRLNMLEDVIYTPKNSHCTGEDKISSRERKTNSGTENIPNRTTLVKSPRKTDPLMKIKSGEALAIAWESTNRLTNSLRLERERSQSVDVGPLRCFFLNTHKFCDNFSQNFSVIFHDRIFLI